MSQKKAQTIKLIYGIAFGLVSLAVALLLILQVIDIYFNGGTSPYTVSAIKEHFNSIAFVIYIWIAIAIAGFVIWEVFPEKPKLLKNDIYYTFKVTKKKLDSKTLYNTNVYKEYSNYQWIIGVVKITCAICVGICIIFCAGYLFDKTNFKNENQNQEMAKASLYMLPFLVVAFALIIGVAVFEKIALKKQLERAKEILRSKEQEGEVVQKPFENFRNKLKVFFERPSTIAGFRIAVAVIGISLLVYGLATGGASGVLSKAITICRQCIGLG